MAGNSTGLAPERIGLSTELFRPRSQSEQGARRVGVIGRIFQTVRALAGFPPRRAVRHSQARLQLADFGLQLPLLPPVVPAGGDENEH